MNLIAIRSSENSTAGTCDTVPRRFDRVVALNPPSPPNSGANRESMGGYGQLYPVGPPAPVLDFAYLVSYLSDRSIPLDVIEAQGLDLDTAQVAARVASLAALHADERILIVARVALCCLDWDLSVCTAIKHAVPSASITVYGSVLNDVVKRVQREACLDYIVQGEPDETICDLVEGRPEGEVAGLSWRQQDRWISNPERPLMKELDRLPFPKWELLPYHRYTMPKSSATSPVPYLPMLTSRGCPFGCHYCPYPISQGAPFRYRSPANVVDEIEHLSRDLGIQYIIFRDPMFSLRQDRVVSICDEIRRRGLAIRWRCETRVDCLSEATLRAMAAAGCEGINFGIESADVEIQAKAGRKPIKQARIIETVALCRQLGIRTFGFFIVGLPGDTVHTVLESIRFAIGLRPTWVQFNAASPMMGTPLRAWALSNGLATDEEYSYRTCHEATMGNENLTKDQVAALQKFAVFFERYLMNRGGVFKDEARKDWPYRLAHRTADSVALLVARTVHAIGTTYFVHAYALAAPAKVRAAD